MRIGQIPQILAAGILFTITASICKAGPTYGFVPITNNNPANISFELGQHDDLFYFTFRNSADFDCSVTDIYWDDDASILRAIRSIVNGPGVKFEQYAKPENPPGGNTLLPPFVTTDGLSVQSDSPVLANGIGPGEWLSVGFQLYPDMQIDALVEAFGQGTLRVAIHVQGFPDGSSQSFVNTTAVIPAPGALALAAIGTIFGARLLKDPTKSRSSSKKPLTAAGLLI